MSVVDAVGESVETSEAEKERARSPWFSFDGAASEFEGKTSARSVSIGSSEEIRRRLISAE